MNDRNNLPPESNATAGTSSGAAGVSRRRLINAGLSAAPVLAALHSETVLAGGGGQHGGTGCVRPSTFSSMKAANSTLSHHASRPKDLICRSPKEWKGRQHKKVSFLNNQKSSVTGFTRDPGLKVRLSRGGWKSYQELSLADVFNTIDTNEDAQLARCVAAAYLSADAAPFDRVWLTKEQCRQIWNGNGNWTPFGTTQWSRAETLSYFQVIFNTRSL